MRPMNVFLNAPPGSGKSFLVNELANAISRNARRVRTPYAEFNISSFSDVEQIETIFDYIQSNNIEEKVPFVLVDECDSKIGEKNKDIGDFFFDLFEFFFGKIL